MTPGFTLTVADFTVHLRCPRRTTKTRLSPEIQSLISAHKKPDLLLNVHLSKPQTTQHDSPSIQINRPFSSRHRRVLKGDLYLDHTIHRYLPLSIPLILDLRNKVTNELVVFCHASGIWDRVQTKGLVFCGLSGAGKSTLARLWQKQKADILNEEQVIIRTIGKDFWCYDVPWLNNTRPDTHRAMTRMPLHQLFLIGHGRKNKLKPLPRSEALRRLFTHAKFSNAGYILNSENLLQSLSFLERLTKRIPVYQLDFVPDQSIVDFVRRINQVNGLNRLNRSV